MNGGLDPRVEPIFARALEAPAAERAHLVREACRGDAELEREVCELLAAHEGAGEFLLAPPSASEPGTTVIAGRFRVLRHIGSGGMGTVYLAEQLEPVRRTVALKLLRAGLSSDEALHRFETERQTVARMNHAGIARLYDSGTGEDGRPWFAMEPVAGEAITSFCDRRDLSLFARVRLVIEVCRAVHHAHQNGVIHRDLKPGNVLVAEQDGRPTPKVIDFGVAKALTPLDVGAFETGQGDLVGTLEYMSPEQALGPQGDVDVRTDVYALGAILYELVAGEHPLPIRDARAAGLASVLGVLREVEPRAPSLVLAERAEREPDRARRGELWALARRVRGDLDWIVLAAVDKDRARRYGSAAELALDLECLLAHQPVSVSPPGRAYRLLRFADRHRAALLVAVAVLASLVVGLAVALHQASKASLQRDLAVAAEARTRQALAEVLSNAGTAVHKTDQELSDIAGGTRARLSFALWAYDCLERLRERPEVGDTIDYALGYANQRVGEAYLTSGDLQRALEWFDRSLAHRERDVAAHPGLQSRRALAVGRWKRGDAALVAGEVPQAEENYRAALAELEALEAEGLLADDTVDAYLGMAHRRTADVAYVAGRDDDALEDYARAAQRLDRGLDHVADRWPSQREKVLALCGSARLLGERGRLDEAGRALDEAFVLLDAEGERCGPANVWERSQRARALLARAALARADGALEPALESSRAALALASALAGADREDAVVALLLAHCESELGATLLCADRGDEATRVLGESVAALERLVRREPRHAQAQGELALACRRMGLALAADRGELAAPWRARGEQLELELERSARLSHRDRARLAAAR